MNIARAIVVLGNYNAQNSQFNVIFPPFLTSLANQDYIPNNTDRRCDENDASYFDVQKG